MRLTNQILDEVQQIADLQHGGHYTIFRFTSHWKAMWGTPTSNVRTELTHMAPYNTMEEALVGLIYQEDRRLALHFAEKLCLTDFEDVRF